MRMHTRHAFAAVAFLAAFCLAHSTAFAAERAKRLTPEETFLRDAPGRLAERLFGRSDAKECANYLKCADDEAKPKFALIYARYLRTMEKEPIETLEFLGPWVMDKDSVSDWERAQKDAAKEAYGKWREEYRAADRDQRDALKERKPGDDDEALFAPFPKPNLWQVDFKNAVLAIEIARCHMDLNRYQDALAIIDSLGKKFAHETRVLSAECAGDLMVRMQMYRKGIDWYEFALKVLGSLKSSYDGFTPEQKIIHDRVRKSLAEAKRLLEIEQYGKGWVWYRDAEHTRRKQRDFLRAYLQYENIKTEFPKTVYSEASTCYGIKCLLALADDENAKKAKQTIDKMENRLRDDRRRIVKLKRTDVPDATIEEMEEGLIAREKQIEAMKVVPMGDDAREAALLSAKTFIEENRYNLYRGEIMVALGDAYLEQLFDPKEAESWYRQAAEWFMKAPEVDRDLVAFDVPGEARQVSSPPPAMKSKDAWGNIDWVVPKAGDLFNRRTCDWYIAFHRIAAESRRCLCLYILGRTEEAIAGLGVFLELDPHEKRNFDRNYPNSYSRLKAEFEQGRLFATEEDLKHFKGKAKVAIMVADYYYEIEQWHEAARRYRQFEKRFAGELDETAEAYLQLMLAYSDLLTVSRAASLPRFQVFEHKYEKTPSWPRAMFQLYMQYQGNKDTQDKALACLLRVRDANPRSEYGKKAMLHIGEFYYAAGNYDEAEKAFEACKKKCAGTWMAKGAENYLALIRKSRDEGGGEE